MFVIHLDTHLLKQLFFVELCRLPQSRNLDELLMFLIYLPIMINNFKPLLET